MSEDNVRTIWAGIIGQLGSAAFLPKEKRISDRMVVARPGWPTSDIPERIQAWFAENPDDTLTASDLCTKFDISSTQAYRSLRTLLFQGKIFQHKFPGRYRGIQYGSKRQE